MRRCELFFLVLAHSPVEYFLSGGTEMKATLLGRRRLVIKGILLFVLAAASVALGQESTPTFNELRHRVTVGDMVRVTDEKGNRVQGQVADLSSSSLVLNSNRVRLVMSENAVREVEIKRRDSLWTGLLIGGGIGAAAGLIVARAECGGSDPECSAIAGPVFTLPGIGIGAVVGALIDRSVVRFQTVFRAPRASGRIAIRLIPMASHDQKGLCMSVSF
jgi:hypothetical protein